MKKLWAVRFQACALACWITIASVGSYIFGSCAESEGASSNDAPLDAANNASSAPAEPHVPSDEQQQRESAHEALPSWQQLVEETNRNPAISLTEIFTVAREQAVQQEPRKPGEQQMETWQQLGPAVYLAQTISVVDLSSAIAAAMADTETNHPDGSGAATQEGGKPGGGEVKEGSGPIQEGDNGQEEGETGQQEGDEEDSSSDEESDSGNESEDDEKSDSDEESEGEKEEGAEDEEEELSPQARLQQVSVGIAYELPVQLRPREGGSDPGYLQLMLDEKAFNELLNRHPNAEEEDDEAQKQHEEKEKRPKTNGVFMVCYVKEAYELETRFERALELGEGVYVPLQHITDFARHKDFTLGNPGVQDVQLSADHYNSAITDWDQAYFDRVKELKKKTQLKVGGMWIGPPDYANLDRLLKQNPDIFDGVYFDWEDGQGACMNNFGRPPKSNADGTKTYWADKPDFFFRYFMGGQDADVCKIADGRSYIRDVPVNVGRELTLPDNVTPVFPCFAGNEGLCYKAFSKFLDAACDSSLQRYSFAIYDRYSDRMRLMLEEGCKNMGRPVPAMDFVGAI